jgi:hypothetical protein
MQTRISEDRVHLGAASAERATVLQVPDNLTHNSIMSSGWDVDKQFLGKGWERSEKRVVFRHSQKMVEIVGWRRMSPQKTDLPGTHVLRPSCLAFRKIRGGSYGSGIS